jgi:dipeptidyl aminopeptidase/acylaminoacyl peptidase
MRSLFSGTELRVTNTRTGATESIGERLGLVDEPAWSADGRLLAFYSDRDGLPRLWVWNRISRDLRRVSDAVINPLPFPRIRWSPDGAALAVTVLPRGTPQGGASGASKKISFADPGAVPGAAVKVFTSHERKGPEAAAVISERQGAPVDPVRLDTQYRSDPLGADLALVRLSDGDVRRIGHDQDIFWYNFSPDGQFIAYSLVSGMYVGVAQRVCDYEIASVSTGRSRTLAKQVNADYCSASWSPDSGALSYMSNGPLADGDVHLIELASGTDRNLTPAGHPALASANPWHPYWSADGRTLYAYGAGRLWRASTDSNTLTPLTPDGWNREVTDIVSDASSNSPWSCGRGRTLTMMTRDPSSNQVGFHRIDLRTLQISKLREDARSYGEQRSPPIASANGNTLVYLAEDARHPMDAWATGCTLSAHRRLTTLNPQLAGIRFGLSRLITFLGADGLPRKAVLVLPSDYRPERRYPTILNIYPSTYSQSDKINTFGSGDVSLINSQLLATRGYAVLVPDLPPGWRGSPMRDVAQGVNLAINKIIELGVADPDRLGIVGFSYGGYSTLAVITQTSRFKAAVDYAGDGDLISTYLGFDPIRGRSDGITFVEGAAIGGPLWNHPLGYIENSPIMHLDRVHTPVLIVHGDGDQNVPVMMGDQVFVGLRRLGREVEYRRYIVENHALLGRENRLDYWRAALRWFDTYVKEVNPHSTEARR